MDNMKHRRLQELDRSDFQIVDGEPDIRGWDVKNINKQKIGAVEELIVDAHEKKVRYMIVDLNDNELRLDHRKVLIPIGLAELDSDHDDVLMPNVSSQQFSDLPEYDRNNLTADMERRICSTLESREQSAAAPGSVQNLSQKTSSERKETTGSEIKETKDIDREFYKHENYNLDNLYKNRLHEAQPARNKNESEYEKGLRLWERRSEGGTISSDKSSETGAPAKDPDYYRNMDEETRQAMIRNRRDSYRQRRYGDQSQDGDENISEKQNKDW
jgi:hypothetical protein